MIFFISHILDCNMQFLETYTPHVNWSTSSYRNSCSLLMQFVVPPRFPNKQPLNRVIFFCIKLPLTRSYLQTLHKDDFYWFSYLSGDASLKCLWCIWCRTQFSIFLSCFHQNYHLSGLEKFTYTRPIIRAQSGTQKKRGAQKSKSMCTTEWETTRNSNFCSFLAK